MSISDVDRKVGKLRELRDLESGIRAQITAIEDELKAEMLARNTDELRGCTSRVTWKTVISRRFDSAAFRLTHAELFQQYSKATTSRRFVIA